MRKTWKVRIHKYVDGKWDNTIEILVKNRKKAKEVLFNEYLETEAKLAEKLSVQDYIKLLRTDAYRTNISCGVLPETFTLSGTEEKSLKKIKYVGEIVKD